MIQFTKSYQTATLSSASPLEQIAFLFEKAAKHVLRAKEGITKRDYEMRFFESSKAARIIHGLSGIINHKTPETQEFIAHMSDFLEKAAMAMYDINFQEDPKLCDSLAKALSNMAQAWRKADQERTLLASTLSSSSDLMSCSQELANASVLA